MVVAQLLAKLNDRERRILVGRFGIGGACEQTLKQDRQGVGDHEGTRPPDRIGGPGQAPQARCRACGTSGRSAPLAA